MSSKIRENSKPRGDNNPSCSNIVKRMVSLPRSILEGVSRAMGHGFDLMLRDRRSQIFPPRPPPPPPLLPPHFPLYPPQYDPEIAVSNNNEWSFLDKFEQDYGPTHPFFYACRFVQALKIAQDEKKFMFMYLHNVDHPFAAEFCRGTLCSEVVVQFIDANFVSWGGLCDRGEGLQMSGILRPASFPFCAVIAPASGDNIALLQQIEGPVSPAELVEILQRTLEEQGAAFGSARAEEEERRRADRRLREEQDAAYFAALKLDQERERLSNLPQQQQQQTVQKPVASVAANASSSSSNKRFNQWPRHDSSLIKPSLVKESTPKIDNQSKNSVTNVKAKDYQVTQILIRFPNGERRENSFSTTDKVQAIYKYIDSLGLAGIKNYRLISSFPRKVFGADQMSMTLKDAGLHPRATLFLEPL